MATNRHARLGPSSSEIWLKCLGAPREWAKYPPRKAGFAAKEGTLAHALCEAAFQLKRIPWRAGQTFDVDGETIDVTNEMLNAVQLFVNTALQLSDRSDWRMVEGEVNCAWLWEAGEPPEVSYGTLDFAACDGIALYVLDFKYGAGKVVSVERNTQLLCYAVGALGRLMRDRPELAAKIEVVCLVIVQPRVGGQAVRQWSIPVGELLYWAYATLKPSIDAIADNAPDLPLTPSSSCFFCAASRECPAYRAYRLQKSTALFPEDEPSTWGGDA
jgi:hypothetical protein